MEKYIINENTLAIMSEGRGSIIFEGAKTKSVSANPNTIIRRNCLLNGCTFSGRKESAELLTGSAYKLPIIVNENKGLIFFPTCSLRDKNVTWINLNNINYTYYDRKNKKSVIVFLNDVMLDLNVSLYVIKNQILKSAHLEHFLIKNCIKKV